MKLTVEDRDEAGRANLSTTDDPGWDDVEAAIRALDQRAHTEVMLEGEGSHLSVSGGADSYFVYIFTTDERSLVAVKPDAPDDEVDLVAGGQTIGLPATRVVDLNTSLSAARSFLNDGTPAPGLNWEED